MIMKGEFLMALFHSKLIELKSIKKSSSKTLLQVRLSFEEDINRYLEVDEFTGKNINTLIGDDERYKYRLSFSNHFDPVKEEYIALLTQTYLEQTNKFYFSCSVDYINNLNSIKKAESINDLDNLSFLSNELESEAEEEKLQEISEVQEVVGIEKIPVPQEEPLLEVVAKNTSLEDKNITNKPLRLLFMSFGIIFIMLFTYLASNLLNQNIINEKVVADSIHSVSEIDINKYLSQDLLDKQLIVKQSEYSDSRASLLSSNINSDELTLPSVDLDDLITYSIPKGKVALSFDDGPSQYSREIVDILKEYEVGGTFFLVGKNIKKYPDHVKYIQLEGYSIGSHSLNHIDMKRLSYEKQKMEVVESMKLIEDITDEKPNLFRPPYGSFNNNVKNIANENNYKLVFWDNDPEDWKSQNANKIFDHIKNTKTSGSIILLHESRAVINALPRIIEYLQEIDLEIVSLK